MELMQLEMFVAVVEEQSIRGAAERVMRTQPAVSMAIRKLENETGRPLFARSGRQKYRLSEAGETLYAYASRILRLRAEAVAAIDDLSKPRAGHLRLGAAEGVCVCLLPKFANAFLVQHSDIHLELDCEPAEKLLQALKNGRLDLALVPFQTPDGELDSEFLMNAEIVFIANAAHPLAARKRVEFKQLGEESLLIPPSLWRTKVTEIFSRFQTPCNLAVTNPPIEVIKKMVAMGSGVGVVPLMCVREERSRGELAVLEVEGFHLERPVCLVRRKGVQSPMSKTFVQLAQEFTKDHLHARVLEHAH